MINFITGRSGSGKTERIYEFISRLDSEDRAVLIVPEQSSFYNEKQLLERLGDRRAANTEVLSFRRLCSNILEEYRGAVGQRINDGIKAVLMDLAIENAPAEGGELELYAKKGKAGLKKTMDLVEPMLTAINEYKMCLITPEQLFEVSETVESRVLASKLRDSARIYAAYNALLENTYDDPDDDLIKLYELLGEYDYFRGMTVFMDSFTGFSAQEIKICERIFSQAKDIYISLCMDRSIYGGDISVFAESENTYRTLLKSAAKTAHECILTDCSENGLRYKSKTLAAVEEGLFSHFRTGTDAEKCENDGSLEICRTRDVYDEISYIAKRIFTLVHDEGYRFNEIEVIARSLDEYKSVIHSEFPKYGIPYFMSDSESLESRALIRMVLSAFDVIHGGFDTEAILRLAKCGFTELSDEDIFELEDYVYIWSIRGNRWKEPFTMSPDGMRQGRYESDEPDQRIDTLEKTRKKLIGPLTDFDEELKKAHNGAEITYALYRYIEAVGCRKKFREFISQVRIKEGQAKAEREASVWDKLMQILDKLYALLSGRRTDSKSYFELLRVYIRKTPLADIPRTINSVTIGIAGSLRSAAPRAVFVPGCNEGEFPPQPTAVGIFTDSERRLLREESPEPQRLPLYDSIFGNTLKEKYNVYAALSAPSEKLFVSYRTLSLSGASCEPSVIVSELMSIIPDTVICDTSNEKPAFYTERQAFDVCAEMWNENTELSSTLKTYFLGSENYGARASAIGRFSQREPFALRDQAVVRKLFGSPLRLSSTKLDLFASCKFAFFCRFGIEVLPIRKASMDGGLYGTAMHFIFEKILSENSIEEFILFTDEILKEKIRLCLNEYLAAIGDETEMTSRFSAICARIRRNAFKTLRRMRAQFMKDSFRPVDFELRIGGEDENSIPAYELELPTGDKLIISGFVDRVDTVLSGDQKYIRIIDYKTGNDIFRLGNIANGVKLQMLLYLSVILKNGTKKYSDGECLLPAGVLYVPSTARSGTATSGMEGALAASQKEEDKNFRMKGLLLAEKEILELMESGLEGEFIPANANKKPPYDLSQRSSVVTAEEFDLIFRYIDDCLKSMGTELYSGNIEAYPEKRACDYCEYKSICRFENGDKYRELPDLSNEEAMERIRKDVNGEGDENVSS